MRNKLLTFILTITLLSLNMISAEIMLSQPSSVYNLGGNLDIKASVKSNQAYSGFFEANLKCQEEKNFHRQSLQLNVGEEKIIETSVLLIDPFLDGMRGECWVEAKFLNESISSQKFKISDKINVNLNIENLSVEPEKELVIEGNAIKENNKNVDGFVELVVEETDIKIVREVKDGKFLAGLTFPANIKSGEYVLKIKAYEKTEQQETNTGYAYTKINVKQVPSKIEIIVPASIIPGGMLNVTATILDQANDRFVDNIAIRIYDANGNAVLQKISESGKSEALFIDSNSTPGYWKINAEAFALENEKLFYVEELEKASFEVLNANLIITNTGNIIYRKAVQISIGLHTEIKNIELNAGESISLLLNAPEGSYDVKISDGKSEINVSNVMLTGNIIGVSELKAGVGIISRYPMVWLFLILVLALTILVATRKVIKRKAYAYPLALEITKPQVEKKKVEKEEIKIKENLERAEHTLVLQGKKEQAGITALRIKNLESIKNSEVINNIIKIIIENKGSIYESPDCIIGIFSSLTTKTFGNEMIAVKVSKQINELLQEHNKKFREKIDYGIALNSGDLIIGKEEGRLKFTNIGNTIPIVKKIVSIAEKEILLSENIHNKVMSEVKTEKETKEGINIYHLKLISEREKYKDFIRDFLERQKEK